ncbi:MAG: thioredoxin-disulfide reductase [Candidatus Aenigmarchaeota archaeon]|nr:thioredoxin-disulfide reductase [Candidatus Aenigmarchaeota archaeon]
MQYDVIIVGAGPAGLTAGIYVARRKLNPLILSKNLGGQAILATSIENYPGFKNIKGIKLIKRCEKQARKFGVEIIYSEVKKIKEKDGIFLVKANDKEFEGKAVILAFGKIPRSLNVPGEERLTGKGISYCATCDLPLFKNKVIAVVGGGNSALEAALDGSRIAKKVYLVHRREKFRGFEDLVERVKRKENIKFVLNSVVKKFNGDEILKTAVVENTKTGEKKELEIEGVFIEIGYETKTDWIKDFVKLDEYGQIVVNWRCETFYPNSDKIRPGVFAAGDVTSVPFKQITVAVGEGCKAALQASAYLRGNNPHTLIEWGKYSGMLNNLNVK